MDKLDGSFNRGYTKALVDVQNWFENHSSNVKSCRLYNEKGVNKIMAALVNNRDQMREVGDCELKYSEEKKDFV